MAEGIGHRARKCEKREGIWATLPAENKHGSGLQSSGPMALCWLLEPRAARRNRPIKCVETKLLWSQSDFADLPLPRLCFHFFGLEHSSCQRDTMTSILQCGRPHSQHQVCQSVFIAFILDFATQLNEISNCLWLFLRFALKLWKD